MAEQTVTIAGEWIKDSKSECSARYPDRLSLRDNGLYTGKKDGGGEFTQWDAGTWEIASRDQVRISTANDAVIAYTFSFADGKIRFRDPEGCEFVYRRA